MLQSLSLLKLKVGKASPCFCIIMHYLLMYPMKDIRVYPLISPLVRVRSDIIAFTPCNCLCP